MWEAAEQRYEEAWEAAEIKQVWKAGQGQESSVIGRSTEALP